LVSGQRFSPFHLEEKVNPVQIFSEKPVLLAADDWESLKHPAQKIRVLA